MENKTDSSFNELMQVCTACNNHRLSQDSYTAPGFMEFLDSPLNIDDIPMQSHSIDTETEMVRNPKNIPWENSIKNFVLDLLSIQNNKIFSTCIILFEFGYAYTETTITFIAKRCANNNTVILYVVPLDDSNETFNITIVRNAKMEYCTITDREYLVSNLTIWYLPNDTMIFCHDTSIDGYREAISMMPESTWSVSCSLTNFVNTTKSNTLCTYICPVYSHLGSMETRAVSSGPIQFKGYGVTNSYVGRMNYYSRSIRGSRHSSGRCYDCQVLYKLLISLQDENKVQEELSTVKFATSFLDSANNKKKMI